MNTRLLAALVAVSSLTAFAQNVAIDVDDGEGNTAQVQVPGVSVQMRVGPGTEVAPPPNQAARPRRPPPMAVVGMDSFDASFELKPQESLRLLGPDGARADIWADDGSYVGGFDVPCEVRARPGQYYRVVMTLNGGLVLDRKFELRQYYRTNVFFRGAQVAPVVVVAQPAPMMQMVDFGALVEAVKAEDFSDGKLNVVKTADGAMTVDQLGQLIDLFTFSGEKVKVVEVCASRLVDRQNAFKLYKHFDFDSDKQKVKAIFGK